MIFGIVLYTILAIIGLIYLIKMVLQIKNKIVKYLMIFWGVFIILLGFFNIFQVYIINKIVAIMLILLFMIYCKLASQYKNRGEL